MKIITSPAKRLSENPEILFGKNSKPLFIEQATEVMNILKSQSIDDIKSLMKLSNDLAELNAIRYQNWSPEHSKKNTTPAIFTFDGEVYRGLKRTPLSEKGWNYLQDHLWILSGLYGILRPLDRIMPYRLEMGVKLTINDFPNLQRYWKETLTEFINKKMKKDEPLLILASNEYFNALDKKKLKAQLIDVKFLDMKNGKLKPLMVYFKQARGEMANFCAENQIKTVKEVKTFDRMGYQFDANLSKDNYLVFTR